MIRRHLVFHLKRVEKRIRRYRLLRNTAICWGLSAALVFGIVWMMSLTESSQPSAAWWVVAGAVMAASVLVVWNRIQNFSSKAVAHAIERKYPDLNERLLTAVEQQSDPENQLSYLREQLVSEVLVHHRRNNWLMTVPNSRMLKATLWNLAGLTLFLVASVVLYRFEIPADASRTLADSSTTIDAGSEYGISVEPGDHTIERGTGQVFIARFSDKLPADVTLVLTEQGAETRRIPLSKSLDDPLFGGQVSSIRFDASYFIEFDNLRTRDYRITVFDFPALLRADATIAFPEYADLPDTVIPDVRSISFVEGSTVTIACFLNKPVKSARLLSDEDKSLELNSHNLQNNEYRIDLTPEKSGRYRLELVDDQGRHNKYPPEFDLTVVPNQRPNLKLAFPSKDVRVSPLEEMALEGTAWDDFGLKRYGVIYTLAGSQPVTVVLGKDVSGKKTEQIRHQLSFEDLSAEPDELVSYYLFAEDFGPDGELRKTFSDMYFAEVRHFEEIFREGRQPPGGQQQQQQQQKGGQSQQAEQLAQLQKQILNATWNVYRRESATKPSQSFTEDVGLIKESQNKALEKVREIEEKLKNPKSKALVKVVADHMKQAAESLGKAVGDTNIDPLTPALTSEQGAYKALLKLRAREFQVSRSQQSGGGGGGGGGGNRSQQQLQQLELSNKQNRYQTNQNAAQANASSANREQLQVLNRLRELARRQGEINEKVKELLTALREAKTEEQKEEIQRRLKRLQEEEQRMLRDIDTLSKRMDQPENQKEMTDSRKQLDQTRSRVLQSSEALKEGRLSQALNSGTRAERDLEKMREDFRKKTAGRFSEEMKDLKNRANELQQNEKNLAQKLDEIQNKKRRTLRDSAKRDEVGAELKDQKGRIDDLQDRMKKVIQQAENSEPLLSRQLYETVRKSREEQPQKALEIASELVNRGLLPEAEIAEKIARKGIDSLKQGIDKAAESILGNELDSLKQAQNKLDQLRKSLEQDLAQAGNQQNRPSRTGNQQSQNRSGKQNPSNGKNNPSDSKQAWNRQASQGKNQQASNSQQSKSQQKGSRKNGKGSKGRSGSKQAGSKQASSGKSGSKQSQGKGKGKGQGQGKGGSQSDSSRQANNSPGRPGKRNGRSGSILQRGGRTGGAERGPGGVLTGNNFQQWSDQLRDVEEMIDDPRLRAQAEKVRERARSMRVEFKRHSKQPNQELVRTSIYEPLLELQTQIAEEIAKKESKDALVPIDRDPVPARYSELVRKYYQELSNDKKTSEKTNRKTYR